MKRTVVLTSGGKPASMLGLSFLLVACAGTQPRPGDYHLGQASVPAAVTSPAKGEGQDIPAPVAGTPSAPRPRNGPKLETYSVVVSQVEIAELLFAMARDARINVDVHPAVRGKVTLNAINQTLPQILSRLSRQVDLRYEFDGRNLVVSPDDAFVRHYTIDYVNMTRDSRSNTSIATQIASAGRDPLASGGGGSAATANNNSTTQILNVSGNHFWEMLVGNLRSLLGDADGAARGAGGAPGTASGGPNASASTSSSSGVAGGSTTSTTSTSASSNSAAPAGSGASSGTTPGSAGSAVIASPETGIVSVRATQRQHEKVRHYIDRIMNSARRQVLIEATVAEVQLSEQFQQGVNWSKLRLDGSGWAFQQQPQGTGTLTTGAAPGSGPGGINFPAFPGASNLPGSALVGGQSASMGILRYLNSGTDGSFGFALSLLQSFGKVKVLSSPKISVLNNQTAVLKVVDNKVYFTIGVQITPGTATTAPLVTYTSTPNTVPVGFVMSVTPQIEETGSVTINVRPTISRIIGYVNDPNPALAQNNVTSRIPEIQTREIESILKVSTGDVAVMGGLMQESVDDRQDAIPGAASLPFVGQLFRYRNDSNSKTELVIFLRPIVIRDAGMDGDYKPYRNLLPGEDFFTKPDAPGVPRAWIREEPSAAPRRESTR